MPAMKFRLENYIMRVQIESRVMGDLALNHIHSNSHPLSEQRLIVNANGLKGLGA